MNTYGSGGQMLRIDHHQSATSGRQPALILLHGAGGNVGYWFDRFSPALTRFGVSAFAPHYFEKTGTARATPELILDGRHFPLWLSAAQDAIHHVAALPHIDPRRIAVFGISLGGYLAMALAAESSAQAVKLRAVLELSGGLPPGFEDRLSPATPPVLILHGSADTVVPVSEARKLQSQLARNAVPHQIEIFPNETHWFSLPAQRKLMMICAAFLEQHL